jgi:hypothetical protein
VRGRWLAMSPDALRPGRRARSGRPVGLGARSVRAYDAAASRLAIAGCRLLVTYWLAFATSHA